MSTQQEYDKEAWLAANESIKEKNLEEIKNMIQEFRVSPEKMIDFLDFQARFYNYSPKNCMLIYSQNPYSLFVGSFQAFKKIGTDLAAENNLTNGNGRTEYLGVKKGAKAMKIFVPQKITFIKNEDGDWIQLSKANDKLKQLYKLGKIEAKQKLSFGIGNVFDISQTNIPPELYPQIIKDMYGNSSEQHRKLINYMLNYCDNNNIDVSALKNDSVALAGLAHHNGTSIELNTRLQDTGRLSTLLHEIGHTQMHFNKDITVSTQQMEVEADIFCVLMQRRFGIDVPESRTRHLTKNYAQLSDENGKLLEKMLDNSTVAYNKVVQEINAVELPEEIKFSEEDIELLKQAGKYNKSNGVRVIAQYTNGNRVPYFYENFQNDNGYERAVNQMESSDNISSYVIEGEEFMKATASEMLTENLSMNMSM